MTDNIISLSGLPLPVFIEGNLTTYRKGDSHPERYNLPFFDVIFMITGDLFVGEENQQWHLTEGDLLVLSPERHHYPVKKFEDTAQFYWFHFYTENKWTESSQQVVINPDFSIPTLHHFTDTYTFQIPKFHHFQNTESIAKEIKELLALSHCSKNSFFQVQEKFIALLRMIEVSNFKKNTVLELAESIKEYLRKNYQKEIKNMDLSDEFHFHENYLTRCMKEVYNQTPMQYLRTIRLEQAKMRLIETNNPISNISDMCGFSNQAYFSNCFKEKYKLTPSEYRDNLLIKN